MKDENLRIESDNESNYYLSLFSFVPLKSRDIVDLDKLVLFSGNFNVHRRQDYVNNRQIISFFDFIFSHHLKDH